MTTRAEKVKAAMIEIYNRGEQPSPGRILRELGQTVTHGGNLNGRDAAVYATVMVELGYVHVQSGRIGRWQPGPDQIAPHTCPYQEEIHGDDRLCRCTPAREHECARDI
jgi:hypothetical protein